MTGEIESIVDSIEYYANRFVGIDSGLHHPDAAARLYAAGREVDTEIARRMAKMNEGVK